ncbi:MAG TPA: rod shape-determining protein [Xanthomonadales bacterium]|nr:rod shape-determining protein [Xanthomonadales bacterium]
MNLLNSFYGLFSTDMGIDLGTANTLIFVNGRGIVIREPAVVARHKKSKQIIAIGSEAKKMLGKTPSSIETVRPLVGGTIADFDATVGQISHYIKQVHDLGGRLSGLFVKPKVVIGIPSAVTEVQRRAVWEAALSAGAREAYLIEEPMAAAIGEGISIFASKGVMVVDIGGGTTEIAVISLGGIVVGRSLKLAGDEMNQAILHYVRLRHGMLLGEATSEEIKIRIGSAFDVRGKGKGLRGKDESEENEEVDKSAKVMIVRGRDIETGLPKSLRLSETEIREALSPIINKIIQAIADVIEETPPELLPDILEQGILLTGGGANLSGLDQLIVERVKMPVYVSADPMTSVIKGAGKVLQDEVLLERVKVIGGLR